MVKRKYRKRTQSAKLKGSLNKLWSEIIRSKGKCEFCSETKYLNAHHHYGKRASSVRWDIDNGVCLCPSCHVYSSVFSAHQTPATFVRWINKKRGKNWEERLRKKHAQVVKYSIADLEALVIRLKSIKTGEKK